MFIPPKAKTVLEFGTGNGETGREFKRIQPACRYIGVDGDDLSLREAALKIDQAVLHENLHINAAHLGLTKGCLDCLIVHGRYMQSDWSEQIRLYGELLAHRAPAVFVVENAGYLPNVLTMLQGQPPLLSVPLSLDDCLQQIKRAGFFIDNVVSLHKNGDNDLRQDGNVTEIWQAFAAYCRAHNLSVPANAWAERFVIRATRQELPPKLMIHSIIGEERVTARVRIRDPYAFVGATPGVSHVEESFVATLDKSARYPQKVLIQHRLQPPGIDGMKKNMQTFRRYGYLVVGEIDDSPAFWRKSYEDTKYVAFVGCHAMQVSTEPLKQEILRYNPHVIVFPNYLKELPPPKDFTAKPTEQPINIFFGALNREDDWEPIMPALNRVIKELGQRVKFTVMFDKKFFAALETDRKELVGQEYPDGYAPYQVYADTLHTADISLLPLVDNERSRMKSDLKFIESGAHTTAVLASSVVYSASVRDGGTGLIYRTDKEFAAKLRLLIENDELRRSIAESAYDYVRRHRLLADHYEERVTVYRELLSRWRELDDDLAKRLADI